MGAGATSRAATAASALVGATMAVEAALDDHSRRRRRPRTRRRPYAAWAAWRCGDASGCSRARAPPLLRLLVLVGRGGSLGAPVPLVELGLDGSEGPQSHLAVGSGW